MVSIQDIRKQLKLQNADAFIITRNNMFLGQDVLPQENKILELCGFDGSAGNLIIFDDNAYLLVDGRYSIQAQQQTAANEITVITTQDSIGSWIQQNIKKSSKFLYDPWCHSVSEVDYWKRALSNHIFITDKNNTLQERTISTSADIFELEEQYAGISSDEKISYLTEFCQNNKFDAFLICESDSVSWLLNLRSNLLSTTPILRAFALVSASGEVSLFVNDFTSLDKELNNYQGKTIAISYNKTPKALQKLMKEKHIWFHNTTNPIAEWKSIKNPIEISGIKNAHLRDGIAVCRFLSWLENNYSSTDELTVVAKLHEFRKQGDNFHSESFDTIAAFASNGAIVHYHPTTETNKKLQSGSLLLLDSGAQYLDGTTDITRTIAIGTPTPEMIDSYTQVLKAHIAVLTTVFPQNTAGSAIDTISRASLWKYGKEYSHGTGHGVGHFLNVHEGPQSLSSKSSFPLKANMIVSVEPGFYKENHYGIRIENLALISETHDFEIPMLKFDSLTLVPYDISLINQKLLSTFELDFINSYHQQLLNIFKNKLDEETYKWLQKSCRKI